MKVILIVFALVTTHLAFMGFSVAEEPTEKVMLLNHQCPGTMDMCCNSTDKYFMTVPSTMASTDGRLQWTSGCSYSIPLSVITECEAESWIFYLTCMGMDLGSFTTTCNETLNENGVQKCPMEAGGIYTEMWNITAPALPPMDVNCTMAYFANGQEPMGSFDLLLRFGNFGCPS